MLPALCLAACLLTPAAADYEPALDPEPGEAVYLFDLKGEPVPVAVDYLAYCELRDALAAKDTEGLEEMYRRGDLLLLPTGTRCRFLKAQAEPDREEQHLTTVRVLDGDHAGEKVYVADHWLGRKKARSRRR